MGLTKEQIRIVVVLIAGATVAVLNQTLLSPAYPSIIQDLSVDATTVQWLTSGYSLMEAIIIPLSAYLVGRFPTRKLFIFGVSLFALGSLCATLAPVFLVLLLGRILQAAACGVVMPMVFTVVLIIFPRERRGQAMGIVSLIIGFAPAVGPCVSGLLVDSIGWRALFVAVFVLAAIIIVSACACLKSYGDFEPTSFDKPSVALCSLGLLSLLYGLATITSTSTVYVSAILIVLGVVLLALFVRRQLKLDVPLLKVSVLSTRNYRCAVIIVAMLQAALVGIGVLLPIYLQNLMGISALGTGLIMLPGAVLGAVIGYVAGRAFDKLGARKVIIPAAVVAALGGLGLVGFSLDSALPYIILVYTLLGTGMQAIMTPLNTWGLNSLDNRVIQHANALQNTTNQVGASLGTAILVSLSATATFFFPSATGAEQTMLGDRTAFAFTAFLMIVVLLIVIAFVKDKQTDTGEDVVAESATESSPIPANAPATPCPAMANPASANPATSANQPISTTDPITIDYAMNKDPYYVHASDTISDVAQIMAVKKTSGVPVIDDKKHVVGFVSDGDIMKYIGEQDSSVLASTCMLYQIPDNESFLERVGNLVDLNVMKIATKNVISVRLGAEIGKTCKMLATRNIKKAPVVDKNGKLVGSLSRSDIVRTTMKNISKVKGAVSGAIGGKKTATSNV